MHSAQSYRTRVKVVFVVLCCWLAASSPRSALAHRLEYRLTGTVHYAWGPDVSLDGANLDFSALIDAQAEPDEANGDCFFAPCFGECFAFYLCEENSVTITITGTEFIDGTYRHNIPYRLFILSYDFSGQDILALGGAYHDPDFPIPVMLSDHFSIYLIAIPSDLFCGYAIPTQLSISDFLVNNSGFSWFDGEVNQLTYRFSPQSFVITAIPDPADFDADLDVDLADFQWFHDNFCHWVCAEACTCEPPEQPDPATDLDTDFDVDLADFTFFQNTFTASQP